MLHNIIISSVIKFSLPTSELCIYVDQITIGLAKIIWVIIWVYRLTLEISLLKLFGFELKLFDAFTITYISVFIEMLLVKKSSDSEAITSAIT